MISYSNLNVLMCMRLWTLGEGTRSPTMEGQTCFLLEKAATNTCKKTFYVMVRTFKAYIQLYYIYCSRTVQLKHHCSYLKG